MTPSALEKQLAAALESRQARHIQRSLPLSAEIDLVDFSSNNYLSLSKSPSSGIAFSKNLLLPNRSLDLAARDF